MGINCQFLHYLDDYLAVGATMTACQQGFKVLLNLLVELRCPCADEKTVSPCRAVPFLGLRLDLDARAVSIPQSKRDRLRDDLISIASATAAIPAKLLRSAAGKLSFQGIASPTSGH